ncbi:hypothetical protein [Mariniflexile sp.]|uniref:DUF7793 family protein n=1 Tax=Mariniflexile sp. TaxID=1979402 RepID=UPI003563FE9F
MSKKVKCGNAEFWLDSGVVFCRFMQKESVNNFNTENLKDYFSVIDKLSNGRYYPLVIDLRNLGDGYVFSVVKKLSRNLELKTIVLSKSFVVSSFATKFGLAIFNLIPDPIIPNRIFCSFEKAVHYSLKTNYIFNSEQ